MVFRLILSGSLPKAHQKILPGNKACVLFTVMEPFRTSFTAAAFQLPAAQTMRRGQKQIQ